MKALVLLLALFVLTAAALQAQAPATISYQGVLESGGTPVNDPAASLTFRLFDDATAGNLLWTETHIAVAVEDGLFAVTLGSVTPLTSYEFGTPLWLEIEEGASGTVLTPRTALTAAPYALGLVLPQVHDAPVGGTAFVINNTSTGDAIKGETQWQTGRGVFGQASAFTGVNYGVYGLSQSAAGAGVYGLASTTVATDPNYGVYGETNSDFGYGVYGRHAGSGNFGYLGQPSYGVYGSAQAAADYAGGFNGNVWIEGNVGIGTGTPEAMLDIRSSTSAGHPQLRLYQDDPSQAARLRMEVAPDASGDVYEWGISANYKLEFYRQLDYGFGGATSSVIMQITPGGSDLISMSNGATLTEGGVWTNASSAHLKEGFAPADGQAILETLSRLPVQTWQYTAAPEVRHVGPTAEDFHAAFGFGGSDKGIGTVDADGVALAAIQALYELVQVQQTEIAQLREDVDALRAERRAGAQR